MTDISHHATQLSHAHQRLDAHETRITRLEIHTAGEAVRNQNFESSLKEIKSGISWITRLIIGGIVAGVVAFIINGGLNVGS